MMSVMLADVSFSEAVYIQEIIKRKDAKRLRLKVQVQDTGDAAFDQWNVEIDKQTEGQTKKLQVSGDLRAMDGVGGIHRFQFDK